MDPVSLIIQENLVEALLASGQIEDAIRQFASLRELDPDWGRDLLGAAYLARGEYAAAAQAYRESGNAVGEMHAYARAGDSRKARELYVERERRLATAGRRGRAFLNASAALAVGDTSLAMALLTDAAKDEDPLLTDIVLRYEPWRGMWHDARFRQVMTRLGFSLAGDLIVPTSGGDVK